ncbi:acyltransferase [uncultured Photobacterium sp.]|uniref:acyltransferase n=1 Tax=uncultured Photobacterium sp. TaxID=173973 RepID=UPI0026199C29|nr:acyltransferase [uncultured Photobacterium sp.]
MNKLFKIILYIIIRIKKFIYYNASTAKLKCKIVQPVIARGEGWIDINKTVVLGVERSPFFLCNYIYIDARKKGSLIKIDDNCIINNNARIISNGSKIHIKRNCLIGYNFEVIDSDFHSISVNEKVINRGVEIGENVFIGNNVIILKGVIVGDNSVIGNGSVVTKNIDSNTIVGGNPAMVIKQK